MSLVPILGLSALLAALGLAACSSDATTDTPPTGSDAATNPTPDGGGGSETSTAADTSVAPDTGGKCNAVVNGGALIPETAVAGAKPAPAGGTIADGTYYLTKHEVYPPANADNNTRKRTIVFAGNTVQTHENDPGKAESQNSGTYVVSGSNITFTLTCPMSGSVTIPYTATATTFTTFSQSDDLFISTKQ